ncbi:hypothetical protein CR513_26955, partial [Mucuna pruriens]
MYIKSTQYNIWRIITSGDKLVNKPEKDYTQDDYNILQLNARTRLESTSSKKEKCLKAFQKQLMHHMIHLMLKKKGKKDKYKKKPKEEKDAICFKCEKPCNFKDDLQKLRKRWYLKKKKSLMATWEDLDSIKNLEDDKQANICLMVRGETERSQNQLEKVIQAKQDPPG